MSSPKVLSNKKNFTSVNDAWEAYYSENKFAISADIQKALKYVPIYYQKKNLTTMAAAYALWNSAEQRFEVFCPKNAIFRSTNLHELGHIYFGHLKNSRKYIAMAEKILEPYKSQIANFLGISRLNVIHDIVNICMDFEINSKLFVTNKEREELNASVQFYLMRRYNTQYINSKIKSFHPEDLSKETVIYFPENFGFPGKKSFLEYVQMMVDYCIHHKKPEIPQNGTGSSSHEYQLSSGTKSTVTFSLPDNNTENAPKKDDAEGDSPFNKEDENNSGDKENQLPSFNEDKSDNSMEENNNSDASSNNNEEEDEKGVIENSSDNESPSSSDTPQIEDIDDDTFAKRFRFNCDTEEQKNSIKGEDSQATRRNSEPLYEIEGESLDNEIYNSKSWMLHHEEEEEEIKDLKQKVDIASNASEINSFILKNALPSIDITSYNDILYNYNRGKTTDVFINKVRTRSTFRKPNIHIYTDVSGSMDAEYTKKVVKAVKAISSRIDTRSSITFYNECAWNTEKLTTLNDEVINSSFIGGGTDLANSLKVYSESQENNSANTLVIISDFDDCISSIKKSFDNIKSTILCIEVGNSKNSDVADEFKEYEITNVKFIKIVNRQYAA